MKLRSRRVPFFILALALGSAALHAQDAVIGPPAPAPVVEEQRAEAPAARAADAAPAKGLPFDYWMLSMSWSPEYCRLKPSDQECKSVSGYREPYGFVVHGLWPQYEVGRPQKCVDDPEPVSDELTSRMLMTMPSRQMIRAQWRRYGTCSGMTQEDYFMFVERAYRRIEIPEAYRLPDDYVYTTAEAVKREFLTINPELNDASIALQCSGRYLKEIRVCFKPDMQPRACGRDIEDRCRSGKITIRPIRGLPAKKKE